MAGLGRQVGRLFPKGLRRTDGLKYALSKYSSAFRFYGHDGNYSPSQVSECTELNMPFRD